MGDKDRRCGDGPSVMCSEHRFLAIRHFPVRRVGGGQIELPDVAPQVTGKGARDDLVAIAHQGHASQAVGLAVTAHARIQSCNHLPGLQFHHQQLGPLRAALITVADHHHPAAIGQNAHLGLLQHMADGIRIGLDRLIDVTQLPQHGLVQTIEVGLGHVQREHGLGPCPGRGHHHVVPAVAPEGIPLDQRAVHHEAGLEIGLRRAPQLGE